MFKDTIVGNIWCEKVEEAWLLYAHPIYIPAIQIGKVWKVIWSFARTEAMNDLFPLGGVQVDESSYFDVIDGPDKISDTQVEARIEITGIPVNPADLVFYTVLPMAGVDLREIYDPTIIVTSDPIYIPPTA